MSIISTCISVLTQVIDNNITFDKACQSIQKDRAIIYTLCHGVLKNWPRNCLYLSLLVAKPLKNKNKDIEYLLRLGLFQLEDAQRPAAIIINELVGFCKKSWAKPVINGCLRRFSREQKAIIAQLTNHDQFRFNQMPWFIQETQKSHPEHWQDHLNTLMQSSKLIIRINQQATTTDSLIKQWEAKGILAATLDDHPNYLILKNNVNPSQLPGYQTGLFYVQNPACHFITELLSPNPDQTVLEIGAFPGGKTTDFRETRPQLKHWLAIDCSTQRYHRFLENLNRMKCWVPHQICDLEHFQSDSLFDTVILDAPCSASGSVRHFSDYHVRKQHADLAQLIQTQAHLIKKAWQWVKPGGYLIYITCSIFNSENQDQITSFINTHQDIDPTCLSSKTIEPSQLIDGLFFSKLKKTYLPS